MRPDPPLGSSCGSSGSNRRGPSPIRQTSASWRQQLRLPGGGVEHRRDRDFALVAGALTPRLVVLLASGLRPLLARFLEADLAAMVVQVSVRDPLGVLRASTQPC